MSQYTLTFFNIPGYGWILLNVSEYVQKCMKKLFCQGFQYDGDIRYIWQSFDYATDIKHAKVLNIGWYN